MKKLVFTIITAFSLSQYSQAQNTAIGFTAGATFATYNPSLDNTAHDSRSKAGFTLGLLTNVSMGKSVSITPALNFTQKGGTAQTITLKDSLLQQSENQKTTAWIMLVGGAGLAIAGFSAPITLDNYNSMILLIIGGTLLMSSSYFPFHAAANNKKQAMRIAFNTQQTKIPVQGGWARSLQPALTITIPLIH